MSTELDRVQRASIRRSLPLAVREAVFARDQNTCVRCGKSKRLTIDHIVPVSRGGTDELANLQVLCVGCNASKGNRIAPHYSRPPTPEELRRLEDVRAARLERLAAEREYIVAIIDARKNGHSMATIARAAGITRQGVRDLLLREERR